MVLIVDLLIHWWRCHNVNCKHIQWNCLKMFSETFGKWELFKWENAPVRYTYIVFYLVLKLTLCFIPQTRHSLHFVRTESGYCVSICSHVTDCKWYNSIKAVWLISLSLLLFSALYLLMSSSETMPAPQVAFKFTKVVLYAAVYTQLQQILRGSFQKLFSKYNKTIALKCCIMV